MIKTTRTTYRPTGDMVCEGRGKLISGRGTTGVYWRSGRLVFQMSPDDSAAHAKIARQMLLKGVH